MNLKAFPEEAQFKIKDIYNCFPDDYGGMAVTKDQRKKFIYKDIIYLGGQTRKILPEKIDILFTIRVVAYFTSQNR